MSRDVFAVLQGEVSRRADEQLSSGIDKMTGIYEGQIPGEYLEYFPKKGIKTFVNLIKNAWNDLAQETGAFPGLRVDPLDETQREDKRAGLQERIALKYLRDSFPTGKLFMKILAWWLVGVGRAVALVTENKAGDGPTFTIRDPRTALPNMVMVANVPVEMIDIIFDYKITRDSAIALGLAPDYASSQPAPQGPLNEVRILEYLDANDHWIMSEFGMGEHRVHGLGKCPAWVFQNFAPNRKSGLSLFQDQVSMMMAVSQLVSLKLSAADKNVNPVYWAKGHVGAVTIGGNILNKLSSSGEMGMMAPPQLIQTDRDIDQLTRFSNIFNKNPEVRQGQVENKGQYTSAKTLEELAGAIDATVDDYWDIISTGMEWLFECAFRLDEQEYDMEKRLTQNVKGRTVRDVYTPSKDIAGHYQISLDYGFGGGGYQAFLMMLQANASKMKSRKSAMEAMPGGQDVDKELRQITIEDLDDAGMALVQSQAASGSMDILRWAGLREGVAKGKPLHEVVAKQEKELREQAAQAQGEGNVAAMTAPPEAPVEEEAAAAPPGLNPSALV